MVYFLNQVNSQVNAHDFSKYSIEVPKIPATYILNLVTGHGSPKGIQFDNSQNGIKSRTTRIRR
jgi:hypothetical protein